MGFDWDNFLTLARELSLDVGDESKLRTAISRAYYSAHHYSKVFCDWNRIPVLPNVVRNGVNESGVHITLTETLKKYTKAGNATTTHVNNAGRLLDTLRLKRRHADYNNQPSQKGFAIEAKDAILKTEKIKDLLSNRFKP